MKKIEIKTKFITLSNGDRGVRLTDVLAVFCK